MSSLIGQTLGGYRIINQIGQGGMATIFKAYQPSLDRYVALKVLPPYLAEQDDAFAKRFEREARSIAKLRHPNILMVHDFGEHGEFSFIVMEFVDAGTFKDYLLNRPSFSQAAKLISQVARALDYAHEQEVVHRDVKPSNILLPKPDWALLTDFGLATMMGGSFLTQSGMTVGTPAYISPEQGRGDKVGNASDIYSLGVILYELATGTVPFTAETPMAVVIKHMTDPLPMPSTKNPNIPEQVERIILKAMAKEPEDRFSTAGQLAEALDGYVNASDSLPTAASLPAQDPSAIPVRSDEVDLPTVQESPVMAEATPDPEPELPKERSGPKARPKRRWPLFAGLGALLVIGFMIIGSFLSELTSDESSDAILEPGLTQAVTEIESADTSMEENQDFESKIEELKSSLQGTQSDIDIYLEIAQAYSDVGDIDQAENAIQNALDLNPDDPLALEYAGWLRLETGEYEKAISHFEKSIEMGGDQGPAYEGIAYAYQELGESEKVADYLERSLLARGDGDPVTYEILGWQYLELGDYKLAEKAFRTALELDPDNIGYYWNLGEVYKQQGDLEGAITILQEGVEANPGVPELPEALGWFYREAGDYENAILAFEKAIEISPNQGTAYSALAELHFDMGEPEKAHNLLKNAIDKNPNQSVLHESLGNLFKHSGKEKEAIPHYEKALDLDPYNHWARISLSWAYLDSGKSDEASKLLAQAPEYDKHDPWMLQAVGHVYAAVDDCNTAIDYFKRALDLDPNIHEAQQGIESCQGN